MTSEKIKNTKGQSRLQASLLTLVTLALSVPANSHTTSFDSATVRLYSAGSLVGEWQAISDGYMLGPCYVFNVKSGAYTPQVKVCGTFSVESKR